jgi:Ala-tRNA(Pro) deacylase
MAIAESIGNFLRRERVPYTTLMHERAYTAQQEAAVAHVPGRHWAKTVVCFADDEPIQAVVPADLMVDLERLRVLAGARAVRKATEDEMVSLYPGCEAGAMALRSALRATGLRRHNLGRRARYGLQRRHPH